MTEIDHDEMLRRLQEDLRHYEIVDAHFAPVTEPLIENLRRVKAEMDAQYERTGVSELRVNAIDFAWMRVAIQQGQIRLPDRRIDMEQSQCWLSQVFSIPVVVDRERPTVLAPTLLGE